MDGFCFLFFIIEMIPRSPARPFSIPFYVRIVQLYYHHIISSPLSHAIQLLCCRSHTLPLSRLFFFSNVNIHPPHIHRTLLFQVPLFPSYLSGSFHPRIFHCCSPIICFPTFFSPHRTISPPFLVSLHHHLICPLVPHLVCSCCSKGVDRRGRAGRERAPRRLL